MLETLLTLLSGSIVGFVLALVGGGGSILAVPLLLYVVGVGSPHVALGTSAVAVAANALMGLVSHARAGHIEWQPAAIFSAAGVVGAALGSTLGKQVDGQRLLVLFGLLMVAMAMRMWQSDGAVSADCPSPSASSEGTRLVSVGAAVGALSGFFGIGGGFLIVPGLLAATGMPVINAVGTSLVSVAAFGLTTAVSYAASGLVDWRIVALFICGGVLGSAAGAHAASVLGRRNVLSKVLAALIALVGVYVTLRSAGALLATAG